MSTNVSVSVSVSRRDDRPTQDFEVTDNWEALLSDTEVQEIMQYHAEINSATPTKHLGAMDGHDVLCTHVERVCRTQVVGTGSSINACATMLIKDDDHESEMSQASHVELVDISASAQISPTIAQKASLPAKEGKVKSSMTDFKLITVLGRGTYGKVTKAKRKNSGQVVALKTMHKEQLIEYEVRDWVNNEKKVLDKLIKEPHPFVVRTIETFNTKALVCHVMDFHPGGDLGFHLQNAKGKKFEASRAIQYFAELACGLAHLHSSNIIYRDVKPENALLNTQGHALIADFGFAAILPTKKQESDQFCGSREYLAPEMIQHDERPYSYEVDWWSLAVMFYQMLTGTVPWVDEDVFSVAIYRRICEAPLPRRGLHGSVWDLISDMLQKRKEDRLYGLDGIKRHVHFEGFDWVALCALEMPPAFVPDLDGNDTKYFLDEFTSMSSQISIVRKDQASKVGQQQNKSKKKRR
mmetsp:Transcript_38909/g.69639  ORF Transcript_38909/g.69639 Transcript_38909/m.69639 type:complete len:467 (-) Transcript_38909:1026-2426(-)